MSSMSCSVVYEIMIIRASVWREGIPNVSAVLCRVNAEIVRNVRWGRSCDVDDRHMTSTSTYD